MRKAILPNNKGCAVVSCFISRIRGVENWISVNCAIKTEICGVKHRHRFRIRALPILPPFEDGEHLRDLVKDELDWFLEVFKRILSRDTKVFEELLNRYGIYCPDDIELDVTKMCQIATVGEIVKGLSLLVRFVDFAQALYNIRAEEALQQLCQS